MTGSSGADSWKKVEVGDGKREGVSDGVGITGVDVGEATSMAEGVTKDVKAACA